MTAAGQGPPALPAGSVSYGSGERCLVFLPGFMAPPGGYRDLLAPLAAAGVRVVVPLLTRLGPSLLLGRATPEHEASRLAPIVAGLRGAHGGGLWLGGHSRGGLVAWLASAAIDPEGLVLVDPVGGGGPPWSDPQPLPPRELRSPVLVVGLGDGGRCAPAGRGHAVFAAAAEGCEHVVIPGAGHADVLDGWAGRLGGIACGPGTDPAGARATVSGLLVAAVIGDGEPR